MLLLALLLLAVVLAVVTGPLRATRREPDRASPERAELETAREAKYREIRDAELDHRMGKLSKEDWRTIDRGLRAEAIEVLKALDALDGQAEGTVEPVPSATIGA